mgnify:CR=1 FL=1
MEVLLNKLFDKHSEGYGVYDRENLIKDICKELQSLQLQQTGVSTCFLEDYEDHFFEVKYKQVSCCKIAPITDENYCPKCGKKILK